jgi:hypothetical protein
VLTEGKAEMLLYKGVSRTDRIVIPALQRYAAEQVRGGMVPVGWEVQTLDEREQQGF